MFLEDRWTKYYLFWIQQRSNVVALVSKYLQTPSIPSETRERLKTFRGIICLWNYRLPLLMWAYRHCAWLDLVVVCTPNGYLVRQVSSLTPNALFRLYARWAVKVMYSCFKSLRLSLLHNICNCIVSVSAWDDFFLLPGTYLSWYLTGCRKSGNLGMYLKTLFFANTIYYFKTSKWF